MLFRTQSKDLSVIERIRDLEPEILAHLRRVFPDVPRETPLRLGMLKVEGGGHYMVLVETAQKPARRLLIKGPRIYDGSRRRVENESRVLREVESRISQHNPSIRCPRVVADYPDRQLLLLEMIEGLNLKSVLFGLAEPRGRTSLPQLLELCGEWLARFHYLTRSDDEGNPFEWLAEALEGSRTIFASYADDGTFTLLRSAVDKLLHDHQDFRTPRCMIHGAFTPYHVLVQDDRIYVIDFEDSRMGYPYQDLAFFTAYYDMLDPCRRLLGTRKLDLRKQQSIFLNSYFAHAGLQREPADFILRVARLLAITRFLVYSEKPKARRASLRVRLAGPWWRHCFRLACRREIKALRDVAPMS
jgi:Ser/Thr protein kinase RdoA (MazF antagonist)